jgi:dephospho-CoA kinase
LTNTKKHILKIGVTGGIGSGKTVVCFAFARFGVPIILADDIAKELSNSDPVVRKKLTTLLGKSAYKVDGSLDRSFVASRLFSDKTLQRKVEAVIHPRVEKEIERRTKKLAHNGERIVIIEAALIYEAGLDKKLDAVVVVDADESERISRVRRRDVVSEDAVRSRITAQLDVKKKLDQAEYVIHNNGSIDELESKVQFLYNIFNRLAKEE